MAAADRISLTLDKDCVGSLERRCDSVTATEQQKVAAALEVLSCHGWHWGDPDRGQHQGALYLAWQGSTEPPERITYDAGRTVKAL